MCGHTMGNQKQAMIDIASDEVAKLSSNKVNLQSLSDTSLQGEYTHCTQRVISFQSVD